MVSFGIINLGGLNPPFVCVTEFANAKCWFAS
jgi:hypothetical protein